MRAMTWWDHGTESVWSQPWGRAIAGPLEGASLELVPSELAPWSTWRAQNPGTTVLSEGGLVRLRYRGQGTTDRFVIGVTLGESASAYPYKLVADQGIINDRIGDTPVAVFVDPGTRSIRVFLRVVHEDRDVNDGENELNFLIDSAGQVTDRQTGTVWDPLRGVATEGPLAGAVLQAIPYISAYDWAWEDFYPHSRFYDGP